MATARKYLFHHQKELQKLAKISKLGIQYLQTYLLLSKAFYSNYQDNLLPASPHLTSQEYLNKIASELEDIACRVRACQSKVMERKDIIRRNSSVFTQLSSRNKMSKS